MERIMLDPAKAAIILIDWQERLLQAMPPEVAERNLKNTVNLIETAKAMDIPVLASEQYPKGLGPTVEPIRNALPHLKPIDKLEFNCCQVEGFEKQVSDLGRTQLIVTGMETHVCVYQTVRSLLELDYAVHVPIDAVASRHKQNWKVGCNLMIRRGAFLTSTEVVLFDLVKRAGSDEFKLVSKMVR